MHHTPRFTLPKEPTCLAILVGTEPLFLSRADTDELGNTALDVEDSNTGKVIRNYANASRPVSGNNTGVIFFDKSVPYADLTWNVSFLRKYRVYYLLLIGSGSHSQLKGSFTTPSFQVVSAFNVHFPKLGPIVTADVTGNLRTTGIGVTYTVSDKTYRSATFFVKDGGLNVKLAATTDGKAYPSITVYLGQM